MNASQNGVWLISNIFGVLEKLFSFGYGDVVFDLSIWLLIVGLGLLVLITSLRGEIITPI